jgi:8-oxo-dGTP pyrophosphatase MutT (NUDIX family)
MSHPPLLSRIPGFDPRHAPVVGVDAHLPPVLSERLSADALRARFAQPPDWTPELLMEPMLVDKPLRDAAVLVPIVLRAEPMLLLTQRAAQLKAHSGQIAFAGGKIDADDTDAVAAALREANEEIGLGSEFVEVIGSLSHYTTGTAFRIAPVVALVQPNYTTTLNADEVDAAFEVPLAFVLNPAHHQRHRLVWDFGTGPQAREWFSMPWLEPAPELATDNPQVEPFVERFIWGATAGMLRNLYRFLSA